MLNRYYELEGQARVDYAQEQIDAWEREISVASALNDGELVRCGKRFRDEWIERKHAARMMWLADTYG